MRNSLLLLFIASLFIQGCSNKKEVVTNVSNQSNSFSTSVSLTNCTDGYNGTKDLPKNYSLMFCKIAENQVYYLLSDQTKDDTGISKRNICNTPDDYKDKIYNNVSVCKDKDTGFTILSINNL